MLLGILETAVMPQLREALPAKAGSRRRHMSAASIIEAIVVVAVMVIIVKQVGYINNQVPNLGHCDAYILLKLSRDGGIKSKHVHIQ